MATRVGRLVKETVVQEVTAELSQGPNFFVTRLGSKLTVPESDGFRRQLAGVSARMLVVGRRLGRRALEPLHGAAFAERLEGSVGLVFVREDAVSTAKLIDDFIRTHEQHLGICGGVVDGEVLDRADVETLAKLPSKPVLLAEVVFSLEAAMAGVILTVEQLIGEVAWVVEERAKQPPSEPTAHTEPHTEPKEE